MWFEPTVFNNKVSPENLAEAQAWTRESGAAWDYDKWQFTADGYEFFDLYCAEYCGTNHSQMQTVVVVHETPEDLNAWIKKYSARETDPTSPNFKAPEVYGKELYASRGCAGCHSDDGTKRVGPSFQDVYGSKHGLVSGDSVTVDENYVIESIKYPKAKVVAGYPPVMPSYQGQLSDDDIYCIIEFLKSISSNQAASDSATPAQPAPAP
jgi:cytochrome c oxidase subunit 2